MTIVVDNDDMFIIIMASTAILIISQTNRFLTSRNRYVKKSKAKPKTKTRKRKSERKMRYNNIHRS